MKRTAFSIILFAVIYLTSCVTFPPTFEEKAASTGIVIVRGGDEKEPIIKELLSKCSPAGRIEPLPIEREGDYVINRALDLGANAVYIYYTGYYSEKKSDTDNVSKLHYITRFWICKQPIGEQNEK